MERIITCFELDGEEKKRQYDWYVNMLNAEFLASPACRRLTYQIAQETRKNVAAETEIRITERIDELGLKNESQLKLMAGSFQKVDIRLNLLLQQYSAQFLRRSKRLTEEGIAKLTDRLSVYLSDDRGFDGMLGSLFDGLPEKAGIGIVKKPTVENKELSMEQIAEQAEKWIAEQKKREPKLSPEVMHAMQQLTQSLQTLQTYEHTADNIILESPLAKESEPSAPVVGAFEKDPEVLTLHPKKDIVKASSIACSNSQILSFGPVGDTSLSMIIVQKGGTLYTVNAKPALLKKLQSWSYIKAITTNFDSVIGLHYSGALEYHSKLALRKQCQKWPAMRQISFCGDYLLGVSALGQPLSTHPLPVPNLGHGKTAVSVVSAADGYLIQLNDGTVVTGGGPGFRDAAGAEMENWKTLIAIDAGTSHFIALTKNGNVLAAGSNQQAQCETKHWQNIIAIAASEDVSAGLTLDGSIVTTNPELSKKVAGWHDIAGITLRNNQMMAITNSGVILSTCVKASAFTGCKPNFTPIPR